MMLFGGGATWTGGRTNTGIGTNIGRGRMNNPTGAIVPDVLEAAHEFCVQSPDGAGSPWSIRVQAGLPPPERLAGLADQLQEWEIEELAAAGRPATWPECPQHPDSHPLAPRASDDRAVWCCPASGQVISVIGALRPR